MSAVGLMAPRVFFVEVASVCQLLGARFGGLIAGVCFSRRQEHLVKHSGKLVLLDKLLPRLKAQGHRVLLFSQFKVGPRSHLFYSAFCHACQFVSPVCSDAL